jgi:hypothetical protein
MIGKVIVFGFLASNDLLAIATRVKVAAHQLIRLAWGSLNVEISGRMICIPNC